MTAIAWSRCCEFDARTMSETSTYVDDIVQQICRGHDRVMRYDRGGEELEQMREPTARKCRVGCVLSQTCDMTCDEDSGWRVATNQGLQHASRAHKHGLCTC